MPEVTPARFSTASSRLSVSAIQAAWRRSRALPTVVQGGLPGALPVMRTVMFATRALANPGDIGAEIDEVHAVEMRIGGDERTPYRLFERIDRTAARGLAAEHLTADRNLGGRE